MQINVEAAGIGVAYLCKWLDSRLTDIYIFKLGTLFAECLQYMPDFPGQGSKAINLYSIYSIRS